MKASVISGFFIGKAEDENASATTLKQPSDDSHWLSSNGLEGDRQGDMRFLGGPDRALFHYPAQHYRFWQQRYAEQHWQAPEFGENISTHTLLEHNVCIGDIFAWGKAIIQISQPGAPCHRLAEHFGLLELPLLAQQHGLCGWFYRVLREGQVSRHDRLEPVQRSHAGLSVAQAIRSFYHYPLERAGLQQLMNCQSLSDRWRQAAARRLSSDRIEDWNARLNGDPRHLRLAQVLASEQARHA